MNQQGLDLKKVVAQEMLERMDELNDKSSYLHFMADLVRAIIANPNKSNGVAEISSILMNMIIAMDKSDNFNVVSRHAADSTQEMFTGMFNIMQKGINGENLSASDIREEAFKLAVNNEKN